MIRMFAFLILSTFGICHSDFAQIINYSKNGKRIKVNDEKIVVNIIQGIDTSSNRLASPGLSLPGILTNFVGTGITLVKAIMAQQQEKYTATYVGSVLKKGLIILDSSDKGKMIRLNIKEIVFSRIIGKDGIAMTFSLVPLVENGSGLFRFKVKELGLPLTKAKIKRVGRYGKTVDLNIDIKLDALWKEVVASKPDGTQNIENNFQIKSATLGQSSILIPGLIPDSVVRLLPSEPYLSGWFQLLPAAASQFLTAENDYKAGWYTLTITIKEANPYAITSKERADFFSSTSIDLSNLLKQFIPSSNNK
jgi:hypothetical protein